MCILAKIHTKSKVEHKGEVFEGIAGFARRFPRAAHAPDWYLEGPDMLVRVSPKGEKTYALKVVR